MRLGRVTTLRQTLGIETHDSDRCDGCVGSNKVDVWRVNLGGMWAYLCPVCRSNLAVWLVESLQRQVEGHPWNSVAPGNYMGEQ